MGDISLLRIRSISSLVLQLSSSLTSSWTLLILFSLLFPAPSICNICIMNVTNIYWWLISSILKYIYILEVFPGSRYWPISLPPLQHTPPQITYIFTVSAFSFLVLILTHSIRDCFFCPTTLTKLLLKNSLRNSPKSSMDGCNLICKQHLYLT
jgi:hypothetical protein